MNNSQNFDPITGQPINQNNNVEPYQSVQQISTSTTNQPAQSINTPESIQIVHPTTNIEVNGVNVTTEQISTIQPNMENSAQIPTNNTINPQQQMKTIATVEQPKQEFIDNTQANNITKKEEKKEGPNIAFIIVLFVIIFAAVLFLFPYLTKVL